MAAWDWDLFRSCRSEATDVTSGPDSPSSIDGQPEREQSPHSHPEAVFSVAGGFSLRGCEVVMLFRVTES